MPRLLLLTLDFPPTRGGVARYLDALASHFRDTITVVAPREAGARAFDASCGYPVVRRTLIRRWTNPRWFPAVWQLIARKGSYDVAVVSHVLPIGTAAMIAKAFTDKPYAVIVHGMDLALAARNPWKRWLARCVLRGAKLVVANSRATEREARETFEAENVVVAYPPLRGTDLPMPLLAKEGIAGLRLLTVSRLVSRKGHRRVLDAIKALRDAGRGDVVSAYRIVGAGPMEGELRRAARELGLDNVVTFLKEVSDEELGQLYEWADLFVMPTSGEGADREGFGMVYLEAARHGVPSIASRLPGVDEAVLDGKTGVLVPDGDVAALADAIARLKADTKCRHDLGSAARERAMRDFTPDQCFQPLKSLFDSF
ncbi:glycosyltransferase family 1 protein [Patescibacteria group bacterium]|nr:MAG: glycosyltransferase family 1 protein [Patescibacteria group bacterium]